MAMTVEDLEKRVTALEQEVRALRESLLLPTGEETPAEMVARHLREAELVQPMVDATWKTMLEKLGIRGQPIPAEELRKLIEAGGVRPEDPWPFFLGWLQSGGILRIPGGQRRGVLLSLVRRPTPDRGLRTVSGQGG